MNAGSAIAKLYNALTGSHKVRKVVAYCSPTMTVKLTRQRLDRRASRHTYLLTIGRPNYAERKFIKTLIKAKEPFPVKKIQLYFYPEKKK